MLTQVLRNLLTNGIKFTPSGTVRMTATDDGDGYVSLAVSDTGIGIPDSEQERVFEEFHQVRSALQATTTGTGLGLPYARRLVEILDGTIDLHSTPDVGSTFTVRLPIGAAPDGEVAEVGAPITVLVVDDDEAFRTAAAGVLRGCGFTVAEIADGRAVAPAVEARRPDIVLLDLRLEQTDGFVVLDTLTSDDNLRTIPVVMVTAYPQDLVNHPAARRATAVLDKTTMTLDDLCEVVRVTVCPGALCDGSRRHRTIGRRSGRRRSTADDSGAARCSAPPATPARSGVHRGHRRRVATRCSSSTTPHRSGTCSAAGCAAAATP